MFKSNVIAVAVFVCLVNLGICRGDDAEKEYDKVSRTFGSMIETIDTMECKVEKKHVQDGKTTISTAIYARANGREKLVVTSRDVAGYIEAQIDGVTYSASKNNTGVVEPYNKRDLGIMALDPWRVLNFAEFSTNTRSSGGKNPAATIKWTVEQLARLDGVEHRGTRLIINVEVQDIKRKNTMEFDLDCNSLQVLDRVEMKYPNSDSTTTRRYTNVKEVQPGIFIPLTVESETVRVEDGRQRTSKTTWTLSEVKVNHKLGTEAVAFKFPKGMLVKDRIKGVQYKMGTDGQPDGPVTDIPKVAPPPKK